MLSYISIHTLRNIELLQLTLPTKFHIISGNNGSGKTTLLEAIYLLSCGRSFRTRENYPLIQYQQESCTVFARTVTEETVSISKQQQGQTKVRINQQPCLRSSELAHFLPCQLVYQDMFQIIDAGPGLRRNMLDWGMFHVKHSYHQFTKEYREVLKQRNALLRQKAPKAYFVPWDRLLCELADNLHALRAAYFQQWQSLFQVYLQKLTTTFCRIEYLKGWDKKNTGKSLAMCLQDQFDADMHRQYTHSGPHQADIVFAGEILACKQTLSRGQQKIMLLALKLAQAQLLDRPCIYLLDDMCAELDQTHIGNILATLSEISGQFFLTALDAAVILQMLPACSKEVGHADLNSLCK